MTVEKSSKCVVDCSGISLDQLGSWVSERYPGWAWTSIDFDRGLLTIEEGASYNDWSAR